ncbi:hypothetical protein HanLR1_Chr03g0098571 [Helianthus annuus]|nr:hypothetical protein HanLR1_Chr03g0098571 [Helianthus annuus]
MVSSSIPDPPGFYRLCIVVPSGGCRVGFSPELVAWWARGSVRAGWAAAGYLSANGCRVRSTRRFLCWTFKKIQFDVLHAYNLEISFDHVSVFISPSSIVALI